VKQGERVLAARQRHGHTVSVADHLEAANRLANFPQQRLFEVHNLL